MSRTLQTSLAILLLTVAGCAVWITLRIDNLLGNLNTDIVNLSALVQSAHDTLDAVNRPCGAGELCGLLAQANKTIVKVGDAVVTTQIQERKAAPHAIAAMDSLGSAAEKLGKSADSLSKTSDAATESAQALTITLDTANGALLESKTAIQSFQRSGDDLDALLKDQAIHRTLDNIADTSGNVNRITFDAQRVSGKITDDFLTPKPWYKKVGKYAGDTFDVGAFLARHY